MTSIAERRSAFRALHQSGCFVLPNPWDGGSATRFRTLGFKAIASTSAGMAWAWGRADGDVTVDEVLAHLTMLGAVCDLPLNADFEAGFADTAAGVGVNVARCIETGVAGLSIEDKIGKGFYPLDEACHRIAAARAAIDASGEEVVLVGRCEAYLMAELDMDEVLRRLNAYAEAGADCLYAPGVKTLADHARLVAETSRPINANLTGTGLSVADFAAVGVRRVSVGAAVAAATWQAFDGVAQLLADEGRLPS
jgi:2-methylisocitrate lyase-like PEP mutase family enzyme